MSKELVSGLRAIGRSDAPLATCAIADRAADLIERQSKIIEAIQRKNVRFSDAKDETGAVIGVSATVFFPEAEVAHIPRIWPLTKHGIPARSLKGKGEGE